MAKASLWQRIKNTVSRVFNGGGGGGGSQRRVTNNRDSRRVTSSNSSVRRAYVNAVKSERDDLERESRNDSWAKTKNAFKADSSKAEQNTKSREDARKTLNRIDKKANAFVADSNARNKQRWEEKAKKEEEYKKATNSRYDVKGAQNKTEELKRRQAVRSRAFDPNTAVAEEKYELENHPITYSAARRAARGMSLAGELLEKKGTKGEAKKAQEYFEKNQNKVAGGIGEAAGTMAAFALTANPSKVAVKKALPKTTKLVAKGGEELAERIAKKGIVRNAAKKEVENAVKKGVAKEVTKEAVDRVAKQKAKETVTNLGEDLAQNITTGAINDISRASANHKVGSKEWRKELAISGGMNLGLGGVATVGFPAAGKGIKRALGGVTEGAEKAIKGTGVTAKDLAEKAARRATNTDRRIDIRDLARENERRFDKQVEDAVTIEDFEALGLPRAEARILADDRARQATRVATKEEPEFNPFLYDENGAPLLSKGGKNQRRVSVQSRNAKPLAETLRSNEFIPRSRNAEMRIPPRSAKRADTSVEGLTNQLDELKGRTGKTKKETREIEAKIDAVTDRLERAKWRKEGGADMEAMQKAYRGEYEGFDMSKSTNGHQSDALEGKLKGRTATVVEMSPDEYMERAYRQIFKKPSEKGKIFADIPEHSEDIAKYAEAMRNGEKFPLPYLDYTKGGGQEGRHRALAAKAAGIDKIPVVIIDDATNPKAIIDEVAEATAKADSVLGKGNSLPSKDAIMSGKATYGGVALKYKPNMDAEARNYTSEIHISDKFFEQPEEIQQHILNHEVAHNWADELMGEHTGDWNDFVSKFITEKPVPRSSEAYKNGQRTYWEGLYGDIGANSASETITRATTEYLDDPDALMKRSPEAYETIREFVERKNALPYEGTSEAKELLNGGRPTPPRQEMGVDDLAGVDEDTSSLGFNSDAEKASKVEAEVKKADTSTGKTEKMTADDQKEFFDAEWRTRDEHTKRGFSTIAVTGDKGFKGVAYDALKNGETVVDVYHDKENLARGAQRVMARADQEGGVQSMIKDFKEFADGKRKLNTKELRDQIYDIIAAVDFANANKEQPWAEELYLSACKAGAEQTSASGLSLHMWQKIAMSSPEHRAKAVRQQILEMFNKSAGMRKSLGRGKGNPLSMKELEEILEKNPALKKTLDALNEMGEATSVDELQKMSSKALLQARRAMPMTALDQLTQWRYVAMLSSPKTHVRNITSNIYSATLGQLRDSIASTTENRIMKGVGKYGKAFNDSVKAGKLNKDDYYKSAGGLSGKIYRDSHTGKKAGFTLDRLNSKIERTKLEIEATTKPEKIERLNARLKDLESRLPKAQKDFDDSVAKIKRPSAKKALESWRSMGKDELVSNIEKFERRQYNGTASKAVFKMNDKMSQFITDALETSDALSLERIYREKFDKVLTANGWDELKRLADSGDKTAAESLKKLEEYAAQEASYTAALDTYRNYNELSSAMSKYVSDTLFNYDAPIYKKLIGGTLHAVMPFTKVPVNLMKRGIDYSPVGLMRAKKSLVKAIESGNITEINRACERLAEGRIGTGIVALGAGLGFADPDGDLITGRLHDTDYIDKKKKDAGYQNYSITLGDKNFTLDWATPTAASVFTGVEFGRMLRNTLDSLASEQGVQFNPWKVMDVPLILAGTMLEPTLQLGVFQGVNDILESVVKSDNYEDEGTNVNPWLKVGENVFSNYVNSMISPAILSQLSRSFAPYDYFITGQNNSEYAFNQQLAKVPFLSERMLGAKTNVWGQIKNEKTSPEDYAKSFAKNLLSPANINKVTWDDTDEQLAQMYKETGNKDVFPKNSYDHEVEVGRIKGEHTLTLSNKELAEYNVARGKSGSDAMADALNTVVFNRFDKDSKGHRTIPHADNITDAERARLIKEYDGKGIKDVVKYIMATPQFKKATPAEQKQILNEIYGTNGGGDNEAKGARRYAERDAAMKKNMTADQYDYYNETPRRVQEALQPAIDSGLISYKMALDFNRNAGKTYYRTDERGEEGGTVTTYWNKAEMMEYLAKKGYSYEECEALYNAFRASNAKEFNGISLSSGKSGRRRRGGYRRRSGGGGSSTVKTSVPIKASDYKASKATYKNAAEGLKSRSSSKKKAKVKATPTVKVEPPKVKFKKYEV